MKKVIFHVKKKESVITKEKLEENFDKYIDNVDDRTKAEFIKARVEEYKVDREAEDRAVSRKIEIVNCVANTLVNIVSSVLNHMVLKELLFNCLEFETTGGFTSPVSKGLISTILHSLAIK